MKLARPATAVLALLAGTGLVACGSSNGSSSHGGTVKMVTHDSFAATDSVLAEFTKETGVKIDLVNGQADAGTVVNKAVLTAGKPEADVLWGVDNTLLTRATDKKVFVPYQSPVLAKANPEALKLDPTGQVTPVDTGSVCVNVDKGWFSSKGVPAPTTLDDLTKPAYKDLLVVENPATSSPGLAFLLATIAKYGDPGWQAWWKAMRANGVKVVDDWTQAYSTDFSGSSGHGSKPLVVSYSTSPPAEVVGAPDPKPTEAPTTSFTDGCFQQVEYAGVLRGTKHLAQAKQLVDFLVGKAFQEDMPLNMYVYPVRPDAALPEAFTRFAVPVPPDPKQVSPADIEKHRDEWITAWTNTVLR